MRNGCWPPAADPTFDTSGWVSSYTGEPIAEPEMREWVDHTVARIRAQGGRRILEIGSGMGLLLFRLAPECERYVGLVGIRERIHSLGGEFVFESWPGRGTQVTLEVPFDSQ